MLVLLKGNDSKLRYPYTWVKHKRKDPGKKIRKIEIRARKDDRLLGIAHTQKEVVPLAKQIVKDLEEDVYARTIWCCTDGGIDLEVNYKPGYNREEGRFVVGYIDRDDMRIFNLKRREEILARK